MLKILSSVIQKNWIASELLVVLHPAYFTKYSVTTAFLCQIYGLPKHMFCFIMTLFFYVPELISFFTYLVGFSVYF